MKENKMENYSNKVHWDFYSRLNHASVGELIELKEVSGKEYLSDIVEWMTERITPATNFDDAVKWYLKNVDLPVGFYDMLKISKVVKDKFIEITGEIYYLGNLKLVNND